MIWYPLLAASSSSDEGTGGWLLVSYSVITAADVLLHTISAGWWRLPAAPSGPGGATTTARPPASTTEAMPGAASTAGSGPRPLAVLRA